MITVGETDYYYCDYCEILHPYTSAFWKFVTDKRGNWKSCKRKINDTQNTRRAKEKKEKKINKAQERYLLTDKSHFRCLKANAKRRGIEVSISYEEFLALRSSLCYYCGGTLPPKGAGMDRKDRNTGYSLDNCVACCSKCNLAKHKMDQDQFLDWVLSVAKHWAGVGDA